ncbi:RHS repeat-associated core domain-containing protein, partial [Paraburkholderia sediminicola]|uniref:RHS repeat-associated core domain-containing protein n=2 Tax=Paraburkholderia sediminicola TaxID=458836 RepID=UPI0038BAD6A6
DELNFMVPDGDWSQRIRVFSPYQAGWPDELMFRRIGDDASQDRYVLRDANNNVIALTDAGQQSQTQYGYEPYGATIQTGVADPNAQQYTGRENDGTGLYYYRNRYYDPTTARFIGEDPIGYASGQTNAYAYVGGNPVQNVDPFGLATTPTADEVISSQCQASVRRVFPGQYLGMTLDEIKALSRNGDRDAKTAWKLLNDSRFRK